MQQFDFCDEGERLVLAIRLFVDSYGSFFDGAPFHSDWFHMV
jgi:hypothetical protein